MFLSVGNNTEATILRFQFWTKNEKVNKNISPSLCLLDVLRKAENIKKQNWEQNGHQKGPFRSNLWQANRKINAVPLAIVWGVWTKRTAEYSQQIFTPSSVKDQGAIYGFFTGFSARGVSQGISLQTWQEIKEIILLTYFCLILYLTNYFLQNGWGEMLYTLKAPPIMLTSQPAQCFSKDCKLEVNRVSDPSNFGGSCESIIKLVGYV